MQVISTVYAIIPGKTNIDRFKSLKESGGNRPLSNQRDCTLETSGRVHTPHYIGIVLCLSKKQ